VKKRKFKKFDLNPFGLTEPVFDKGATPTDEVDRKMEWIQAANWYNYEYSGYKEYKSYVLEYAHIELDYTQDQLKALKLLPDHMLCSSIGKMIKIHYRGWEFNATEKAWIVTQLAEKLVTASSGRFQPDAEEDKPAVKKPSIIDHQRARVAESFSKDYDILWDQFNEGNYKAKIGAYELCTKYSLKGAALNMVRDMVEYDLGPLIAAYSKTDTQFVESYSHITKANKKKIIDTLTNILTDIDKVKLSAKTKRVPKAKKPKASDKQVLKLKYKTDDVTYKVASINPIMIPTKSVLWTFNTKTRMLTMLKTDSIEGFTVSGTSIKGYNAALSKTTKLRKPLDVLPKVLKQAPKKLEKIWDTFTTKVKVPTGRINADTILLRVID
jgi:hypothetical protein